MADRGAGRGEFVDRDGESGVCDGGGDDGRGATASALGEDDECASEDGEEHGGEERAPTVCLKSDVGGVRALSQAAARQAP